MPDFPISDEAVEAAAEAIHEAYWASLHHGEDCAECRGHARAAIQGFLRAEGFEVERDLVPYDAQLHNPPEKRYRLVSRWTYPENAKAAPMS